MVIMRKLDFGHDQNLWACKLLSHQLNPLLEQQRIKSLVFEINDEHLHWLYLTFSFLKRNFSVEGERGWVNPEFQ